MAVAVEKRFVVEIVYNGVTKPETVEQEESVIAVLQRAIAAFGITQAPHVLSLFREDGSLVPENESVERAGLKPGQVLLLRPSAVKGGHGPIRIQAGFLPATLKGLRECGQGMQECVHYWIGPSTEKLVDRIEHPRHRQSTFGYEVDGTWLTDLWKRLVATRSSLKAQIHTHPCDAFHSRIDDEWPIVSQVGFISIVIPDFGNGDQSLDGAWIGRIGEDGKWHRVEYLAEALIQA